MIVTDPTELAKCRPCPECGGPTDRLYVYPRGDRTARVGYCCGAGFAAGPGWRTPKPPKPPKPTRLELFVRGEWTPKARFVQGIYREAVMVRDGWACRIEWYGELCLRPANTIDHIVPWFEGGRSDYSNLRAACAPCNFRKGGLDQMGDRPPPRELTSAEWQLVNELDGLGLAPEIGSRTAHSILRSLRLPAGTWVGLAAACDYRRQRGSSFAGSGT